PALSAHPQSHPQPLLIYPHSSHCPPHHLSPAIFFFIDPPTTGIYTLSLHDALPISRAPHELVHGGRAARALRRAPGAAPLPGDRDRKSTRLNSSHVAISYAVFCLKKKRRVRRNFRPRTETT